MLSTDLHYFMLYSIVEKNSIVNSYWRLFVYYGGMKIRKYTSIKTTKWSYDRNMSDGPLSATERSL